MIALDVLAYLVLSLGATMFIIGLVRAFIDSGFFRVLLLGLAVIGALTWATERVLT